jgi:hypothetical protein
VAVSPAGSAIASDTFHPLPSALAATALMPSVAWVPPPFAPVGFLALMDLVCAVCGRDIEKMALLILWWSSPIGSAFAHTGRDARDDVALQCDEERHHRDRGQYNGGEQLRGFVAVGADERVGGLSDGAHVVGG